MTIEIEVHVRHEDGRWYMGVDGERFGGWAQHRAVKLALKTARAIASLPGVTAKVMVFETDGAVRTVLSFCAEPLCRRALRRSETARDERAPPP